MINYKIIIFSAIVVIAGCGESANQVVHQEVTPNKNAVGGLNQNQITVPVYEMPKTPSKSKY